VSGALVGRRGELPMETTAASLYAQGGVSYLITGEFSRHVDGTTTVYDDSSFGFYIGAGVSAQNDTWRASFGGRIVMNDGVTLDDVAVNANMLQILLDVSLKW
jgi:hypothetical protein